MKTYQKKKMYIVGKDDNKIHKILTKRGRCIFDKSSIIGNFNPIKSEEMRVHLLSHSIYPNNSEGHIVIRLNMGYIELSVGDTIFLEDADFYIIRTNSDKTSIRIKFKFVEWIFGYRSYSAEYLNNRLGL